MMKRLALASLLLPLAASWALLGPSPRAATRGLAATITVRLNGHTFTLPPGFEIELVAGPPLVDRPIAADFDEKGRLYVSDSSGSNEPVKVQLQKKPHRIVRLEDTDDDGRFDRRTVFADRMMFPEGVMWRAGSLYVAAPPSIWKLTDTDGDGVADKRSEWFQGKTLTGCANDLHGPYAAPDGWIYWCKGAFAPQTYERPGRAPLATRAAHVFRARPDGTGVEPVMAGGMDNPVDVVFTPGGERIFTTTFLQFPGGGKRDGLVHAIYGGVYGKDWDVVYNHPWTGPSLMPVLTHLGAAAPSGLTRYASRAFGPEYQNNLFAALFNLQKVTRHVLIPDGAMFKTRDEDFLVSDNKDFHPTDVIEDADGSLLVVDTGGWYKLCCPTSQLVKPDVLGAIYRVRRTGTPRIEDPRGLKFAWGKMSPAELTRLLDDPRPAVRRRAIESLADRGPESVPALLEVVRTGRTADARRNAVWSATRIDDASARAVARQALGDADETTRHAAAHSASVRRDRGALGKLMRLFKGVSLPNRRAAAEALGRIGDKSAVPTLLNVAGEPADRAVEHSITYALIEIADPAGTAAVLKSANPGTRRAALTALDQMPRGGLKAEAVTRALASPDAQLRETAWWIAGRHPEWAAALSGFLRDRLAVKEMTPEQRADLVQQLAKLARGAAGQTFLAERLQADETSAHARQIILRAMARSGLKQAPARWLDVLVPMLAAGNAEVIREAVATVRALRLPKLPPSPLVIALLQVGNDAKAAPGVRLGALAAAPGGLPRVDAPLFAFLRSQIKSDQPVTNRTLAADVLAHARLSRDQLFDLTETLRAAGPLEVDRLLAAFSQTTDDDVGQRLLAALKLSRGRSGLRADALRERLAKYSPAVRKRAEELAASLNVDAGKQRAKLERMLASLEKGDVRRGQAVFNGAKAACASCHAIGYLGGNIGPDLTHIGRIRTERDLLEAIVFPSASFVRGYEPVVVTTTAGRTFGGVVRRDGAEELVLATGPNEEVRVPRDDIDNVQPGRVSIMPAGLDQQLTPRELADLVAFLKACR